MPKLENSPKTASRLKRTSKKCAVWRALPWHNSPLCQRWPRGTRTLNQNAENVAQFGVSYRCSLMPAVGLIDTICVCPILVHFFDFMLQAVEKNWPTRKSVENLKLIVFLRAEKRLDRYRYFTCTGYQPQLSTSANMTAHVHETYAVKFKHPALVLNFVPAPQYYIWS